MSLATAARVATAPLDDVGADAEEGGLRAVKVGLAFPMTLPGTKRFPCRVACDQREVIIVEEYRPSCRPKSSQQEKCGRSGVLIKVGATLYEGF